MCMLVCVCVCVRVCACVHVCVHLTNLTHSICYYSSKSNDKNIPMAPNPLSVNDDDDKKLAKLEAETSHQTSATLEGPVMPDTESIVDSNIGSQPLKPSDPYVKLRPPQPLDQCDSNDKLPSLIKVRS